MYRIVENTDGSTDVYSTKTGQLICSVNSVKSAVGTGHSQTEKPAESSGKLCQTVASPARSPVRLRQTARSPARLRQTATASTSSPRNQRMGLSCERTLSASLESANSVMVEVTPIMNDHDESGTSDDDVVIIEDSSPLPSDDQDSAYGDFLNQYVTQEEFLQCMGIVSKRKFEENAYETLQQQFPLRTIAKTVSDDHRKSEFQAKIFDVVEICSPLGIRVLQKFPNLELDENAVMASISKIERYTLVSCTNMYNGKTPLLRNRENMIRYPVTYRPLKSWRADGSHIYSFSRKQKREHLKSIRTGLNARSRRLKRLCQNVSVNMQKLSPEEIKYWLKKKPSAVPPVNSTNCSTPGNSFPKSVASCNPFVNKYANQKQFIFPLQTKNLLLEPKNSVGQLGNVLNHNKHPGNSTPKSEFSSIKTFPLKMYLQNVNPRRNSLLKRQQNVSAACVGSNDDVKIIYVRHPTVKVNHLSFSQNSSKISPVKNCSVPLQDVSKQIDGKSFVKGTAIKACGIKGVSSRPKGKSVLLNNSVMNSNCVKSNLLDHAYHRNPLVNSTRQASRPIERGNGAIMVRNFSDPHPNRENIQKIGIPMLATPLPKGTSLFLKRANSSRLHDLKYSRSSPSVLAHNSSNVQVKPAKSPSVSLSIKVPQRMCPVPQKPNVKQQKMNIQVIDITGDNPRENLLPVTSKPNALKWLFRCYGCGFCSMFFSKLDFDEAISKHMTQYHSVTEPDSFLNSFLNTAESAIVTEAFPGYKSRSAQ